MRSLCSLMQGVWVPRMHGNTRPFILDHPLLSLVQWSIGPPSLLVSTCLHILLLTVKASVKAFPQKVIAKVCVRTPESLYQSHQGSPNVPKIRSPAHHQFGLVAGQIFATSPKISLTSNTQHNFSEMSLLSVLLRLKQKPQQANLSETASKVWNRQFLTKYAYNNRDQQMKTYHQRWRQYLL